MSDSFYRAFEDRYRGSRDLIKDRLTAYRPFVSPLLDIYHPAEAIDLGCGRGEWLELLSAWGFTAKGIDLDIGMLSAAQELGFEVVHGDAIAHLTGRASESTAIVSAFHLVEHLPFDDLRKLIGEALRVLKPGGLLIMETPNPENIVVATRNFYLDPTHQKPIPSDLLAFAAEHAGFARVKTVRLQESKTLIEKTKVNLLDAINGASPDYAVVAQKGAPAEILSRLDEPFSRDYGLSLDALLNRFDAHIHTLFEKIEAKTQQAEAKAQQAEAKAQQAEAKAQQANTQLSSIYSSRSWRITAPLRHTSALLKNSLYNHDGLYSLMRSLVQFCANSRIIRTLALPALKRLPKVRQKLVAIYTNQGQRNPTLPENTGELRTILPRRTSSVRKECIESTHTLSNSYTDSYPIDQLIIDGHFNGSYSLASVNRHIVNRLLDSGFERLISISPREGSPRTKVDLVPSGKAELHRLNNLVHNKNIRDTTNTNQIWLYHHYPLVKETQEKATSIALFFWEESLVPDETIRTLNECYDGIITTSWFVQKALIDSGCQIPIETVPLPLVRNPHANECRAEDILSKDHQKRIRLLHVSSCFPRKGADILLKAFSTLAEKYEDVELVIKSFHNPHNTIESLIDQIIPKHLHSRLQLILDEYDTKQMAELYRRADIIVLPTRGEGLNMPAIEAGEFSRLLVTTAHGAQTDYIKSETASLINFRFDYAKTHLSLADSVWVEPSLTSLEREISGLIEGIQRADHSLIQRTQSLRQDIEKTFFSPDSVRSLLSALSRFQILPDSSSSPQNLAISIVTTWGEACGIAEYSRYLAECFSARDIPIKIISAQTAEDAALSEANNTLIVERRWIKGATVDQDLMDFDGNVLWLQHHFAFYPLDNDLALRISSLRSNGKSVFITMHTTAPALHFAPKQLAACAECLSQFDRVFVHTLADLNNLMQIGITDNVTLMPQGVSQLKKIKSRTPEIDSIKNKSTLIGSFGFLFPHKGVFELINAFYLYINNPKTPKDAKLRLVTAVRNDGYSKEEYERCQELALHLGIESKIEWFTDFLPIERTQELLSECDVIVLAYQRTQESSSAAVRMAVACCDSVACTPLPIFDEVRDVTFEINGFTANDIAKTLLRLRDDLSGDIRSRRKDWLENHYWDRVASRYIGIFKGIRMNSKTQKMQQTSSIF